MERALFANSPIGHLTEITGTDGRTGRAFEHFAFVPHPLGAEPTLAPETWHEVTSAHRALAKLDAAAQLIPNPALLRRPTLSREAQSTSALEGTYAPLEDVLSSDLARADNPPQNLVEVLNYFEAAEAAYAQIEQQGSVTEGLLAALHRILVRGTTADTADAGRVRSCQVVIGSTDAGVEGSRFVPMPPGTDLEAAFSDLVQWIGPAANFERDGLVAAAMAHYQFETVHPFNDGNGRIGRLLVVLQFMLSGLLAEPLLSVSPWFEARRIAYQDELANVSITGQWDRWVRFFVQGIRASAIDSEQRIARLLSVQGRYADVLRTRGATGIIRDVADLLIGSPILTVPELAARVHKPHQTVNTAVLRLVEAGILTGPIGTYNRRFVAPDVIDAITAPASQVPTPDLPLRSQLRARN